MLHLFKYSFIQITRDFSRMFWALAFPLILGTLFYLSFGKSGLASTGESEWDTINVAVLEAENLSESGRTFQAFLKQLDGTTIHISSPSSEKEALKQLKEGQIAGIFTVNDTPSLTVEKNGMDETILESLLTSYKQKASMLETVAASHPERLSEIAASFSERETMVRETSLGGDTLDPNVSYFFALIAFACMSGVYLGVQSSIDSQANLSALGARRGITPTHKLRLILSDMAALLVIHLANVLILNLYIVYVLGISLGKNPGALLLTDFMGCTIGVCLGIVLGCMGRFSVGVKMGMAVTFTLIPGFLAGLMFGNMKNIIELHCPILNRVNPAAVLSDAFYCISVYDDRERLSRCLGILAAMSILCLIIAFCRIRRERYDSI